MSGLARNQADQLFGAGISQTPTVRADISGHDRAMPRRAGIIRRNEITAVLASGFAARMILILHDGFLSLPGCRRSTGNQRLTANSAGSNRPLPQRAAAGHGVVHTTGHGSSFL